MTGEAAPEGASSATAPPPTTAAAQDHAASAARQLVDVVAPDGTVIRQATRAEVRAGNLWHRSVFVVVTTSLDEVVVHRRADWKDVWPSRWDLAFGGVVDVGETVEAAARRELQEEAGVRVEPEALTWLAEGTFEDDRIREVGTVFRTTHDGPFRFDDGEVVDDARIPVEDLERWCDSRALCDDSVALVLPALLADLRGGEA